MEVFRIRLAESAIADEYMESYERRHHVTSTEEEPWHSFGRYKWVSRCWFEALGEKHRVSGFEISEATKEQTCRQR